MRCFVIGDNDMIVGFRLVGLEGTEVTTVEEAREALTKTLTQKDTDIILISEEYSSKLSKEIEDYRSAKVTPLIVEIPGHSGVSGRIPMSDLISKTLGIRL